MERKELVTAALTADYTTLREEGWLELYEGLKGWWPKRMEISDLAPYLDAFGEEKPEEVMDCLRTLRGEVWRPSPSLLYRSLHTEAAFQEERQGQHGAQLRADQTPEALMQVRALVAGGHRVCECVPRPAESFIDRYGVIRCGDCSGIDLGQADQAEEAADF